MREILAHSGMMLLKCECGRKGKQEIKTGTTNLLLHGGSAPPWLFERMYILAGEVVRALVYEHGQEEFLRRISDPSGFRHFPASLDSTGTPLGLQR